MRKRIHLAVLITFIISGVRAQEKLNHFYYVEPGTKDLPVFVRGNIEPKKILLYIQGGGAENGIDFGRSDYPKWKNTLERKVAIAYFDQRGLNKNTRKIDASKINEKQVLEDIITIARSLYEKYDAEIHLFGHSMGGVKVLKCLASYPEETSFIKSGIVFNSPITTDFSPERYNYFRPLYLKNLSKELIEQGIDIDYWQEAYDWMEKTDSIATAEDSKKWNAYVDSAVKTTKRKITLEMILQTIFSRPYNPFKYFNNKDNKFIADKLWYAEKELWDTGKQLMLWDLLPKIEHEILLITGRYDAIAVPEEMTSAQEHIKNAQLVILPNAAHESYLDQPELFNDVILSFLE